MHSRAPEYGLEFLLAFDGRIHHLEEGYWIKFEIERVKPTKGRPHGLSYSFTLHAPDGTRLVGFDNAHGVPVKGSRFKPNFNSVDAVVRLLTPENRQLLALIRDRKPQSVAELVEMSGRAQPNLTRTLAKMASAGFITMKAVGRRKAPVVAVKKIVVEIDPYSDRDRLSVA